MLKQLFSHFAEYGILNKHSKDISLGQGTHIALLDKKFFNILKEKINIGALPHQSAIY